MFATAGIEAIPRARRVEQAAARQDSAVTTVAVAHENALVTDILLRACQQRGLDVREIGAAGEIVTAVCMLAPMVLLAGEVVGGHPIDDVLPDLLATGTRVIVVAEEANLERMTPRLCQGASGYLLYDASPAEIAVGVQAVARGGAAISHTAAALLIQQWRVLHAESQTTGGPTNRPLTPREREVLAVMAQGLPTKAIAKLLGVAVKTVENHKVRIFEKLDVRTQAQAVTVAWTYGLAAELPNR